MANNYLQFALLVTLPDQAARVVALAYYESDEFLAEVASLTGAPAEEAHPDFYCSAEGDKQLWVRSGDEYGNVETAAAFLAWISQNLLDNAPLGFSWAETCSKLRPGEFGGGAFWTDGRRDRWLATGQFLTEAKVVNL